MYTEKATGLQSALCPIKLFQKYIRVAEDKESEEIYIFSQICHSKQGFKLKDLDKSISYTRVRDILLTSLKNMGLDKTQFALHSLRSGETTATANFGITGYFKNTEDGDKKRFKTDMFMKTYEPCYIFPKT